MHLDYLLLARRTGEVFDKHILNPTSRYLKINQAVAEVVTRFWLLSLPVDDLDMAVINMSHQHRSLTDIYTRLI